MKTAIIFALLAINGTSMGVAQAAEDTYTLHKKVSLSGVDFTTNGGKDELYRRLRVAANHVCEGWEANSGVVKYIFGPYYSECVSSALTDAAAKIQIPGFSSYVASRIGKPTRVGSR